MEAPAFITSLTGAAVTSRPNLTTDLSPRRPHRPSSASAPTMIVGSRTSTSPFGQTQQKQTYTVKVMQNDRCTIVEVDQDTNLRKALLDNKVDLYTLGGKLRNCAGGGQCGTCVVSVEEGLYMTNGRTAREEHLLENKPDSWRLACRTMLHGDVTIRTKPKA